MLLYLLIILFATVSLRFYVSARRSVNYWRKRGIVAVKKSVSFDTTVLNMLGCRSLEQVFEDIYAAEPNARLVGYNHMFKRGLLIRDPELIHRITTQDISHFHARTNEPLSTWGRLARNLFLLRGEEWETIRRKMNPIFLEPNVKNLFPSVQKCANMLVEHHIRPSVPGWSVPSSSVRTGMPVNVQEAMSRFALDVVGKCVFGLPLNTLDESEDLYREVHRTLNVSGVFNNLRLLFLITDPNLLTRRKLASDDVQKLIFKLLRSAERLRREGMQHRDDFLQLMFDVRDDDKDSATHVFTDDLIASNTFLFYFVSHDFVANTLAFLLYEISVNPQIQERLRREIDDVYDANDGDVDFDSLKDLPYLDMVVSETLRLHGPFGFMSRLCTKDYEVPGLSCKIKAGEHVMYSISAIHKDEKYFPNPLEFDPERFSPENVAQMSQHAYLPFGSGARMCIGMRFTMMEIKVALIALLSRYRFSQHQLTEFVLKRSGFFHEPQDGITLFVKEL